jgi:hypothetical protein
MVSENRTEVGTLLDISAEVAAKSPSYTTSVLAAAYSSEDGGYEIEDEASAIMNIDPEKLTKLERYENALEELLLRAELASIEGKEVDLEDAGQEGFNKGLSEFYSKDLGTGENYLQELQKNLRSNYGEADFQPDTKEIKESYGTQLGKERVPVLRQKKSEAMQKLVDELNKGPVETEDDPRKADIRRVRAFAEAVNRESVSTWEAMEFETRDRDYYIENLEGAPVDLSSIPEIGEPVSTPTPEGAGSLDSRGWETERSGDFIDLDELETEIDISDMDYSTVELEEEEDKIP